ncbi:unnamed protein product, partial [Laminaria digitata]
MIPLQLSRTLAFGLRWSFRSNAAIANTPNPFLKVPHPSPAAVGSASCAVILRHTTTCGCRRTATTATATATSALNLNMSCLDGPGGEGGEARIAGGCVVGSAQHRRQGWWRRSRRPLSEKNSRERRLLPFSLVRSLSSKRATSTTSSTAAAAHAAGAAGGAGGAAGAPQGRDLDGGPEQQQQHEEQEQGEGELDEAFGGASGGDDDLVASLVDEFVWRGEEEEEED